MQRLQHMAVYNRVSEQRLDDEQHQQAAGEVRNSRCRRRGSGRCSAHIDDNVDTVKSLLLSQEDKPQIQSHWTVRRGDPSMSVSRIIHKDLRLKCCKKNALNNWLKRIAYTRYFRYPCSLRDDNVITSKPTWKLKHTNSILEYFEYFCQISSKSIHIISTYIHRFNVGSFLPARHYASAGNRHSNVSVRPSVCHAPVLCQNEES